MPLGVVGARYGARGQAFHELRERRGAQSRAVDENARAHRRLAAIDTDRRTLSVQHHTRDGAARGEGCAVRFRFSEQREHQGLRIDDARERGVQGCFARKLRFDALRLRAAERDQIHAIGARGGGDSLQRRQLRGRARDDQLAAAPVRDAVLAAELVQPFTAGNAQACLERVARIVDTRVYHLAVAGARTRTKARFRFQHERLVPLQRELARDGEPDYPRSDNDRGNVVHARSV